MKKNKIIYVCAMSLLLACNSGERPAEEDTGAEVSSQQDSVNVNISGESIEEFIHSIPSPIEISSMIQNSGAEYNSSFLNPTENAEHAHQDYQKALNLGAYGVDLGYLYLYDKTLLSVDYVLTIKKLSSSLKIDQFFDFNSLKKLSQSNKNVDSLIEMTTRSFLQMNNFLREQKRAKISVFLVIGTWVEGMYLATQIASNKSNKDLNDRIGEQKVVLDNVLLILDVYKNDPVFKSLLTKFDGLRKLYDTVQITYTYGKPVTKEIDGELVIMDNSSSTVEVSPQQIKEITTEIYAVRNEILK